MRTQGIAGDKMFAHLERIVGDHRPITADIFLTNYCNNRCPYCTYARWDLDADAQAMTFDDFVRYAERLNSLGVMGYILTGGGEPTLAPDFRLITKWLEERGMHYGINTNFNRLVRICPDYLKVSLDGWDEDSYQQRRGVRRYETVKNNIREYAEWKRTYLPETSLGIQCVVNDVADIERFYKANADLDVDYIVFRPQESTGGKAYLPEEASRIAAEVMFIVEELKRADQRVVLNFKWQMLGVQEARCTAAWAQIALNERGEVMYCCHKPYQIIGHVMDDDIVEKKNAAVTDMNGCDIPCRMTAPNAFVAQAEAARKDAYFI